MTGKLVGKKHNRGTVFIKSREYLVRLELGLHPFGQFRLRLFGQLPQAQPQLRLLLELWEGTEELAAAVAVYALYTCIHSKSSCHINTQNGIMF